MAGSLTGIPLWTALMIGAALIALGGLLALQISTRARSLRTLRSQRLDQRAALVELQSRLGADAGERPPEPADAAPPGDAWRG